MKRNGIFHTETARSSGLTKMTEGISTHTFSLEIKKMTEGVEQNYLVLIGNPDPKQRSSVSSICSDIVIPVKVTTDLHGLNHGPHVTSDTKSPIPGVGVSAGARVLAQSLISRNFLGHIKVLKDTVTEGCRKTRSSAEIPVSVPSALDWTLGTQAQISVN